MKGATLLKQHWLFGVGELWLKISPEVAGLDRRFPNKCVPSLLFAQSTRSFWQAVSQQSIVKQHQETCAMRKARNSIHFGFRKHGGRIA